MSPTESDSSMFVSCEASMKTDEASDGFKLLCDPVLAMREAQQPQSVAESNKGELSVSELESDDRMSLFKLAVIFARGNPFDNRKHWRMRCPFLETSLKIGGCFEKIREVGEEITENLQKETVNLVSRTQPLVRVIHVLPKEEKVTEQTSLAEDQSVEGCKRVHKEICRPGGEKSFRSCSFENGTSLVVNQPEMKNGECFSRCALVHAQTDLRCYGNENVTPTHDLQIEKIMSSVLISSESEGESKYTVVRGNKLAACSLQLDEHETATGDKSKNVDPGFFTKIFLRFRGFFRRNRIGALPLGVALENSS